MVEENKSIELSVSLPFSEDLVEKLIENADKLLFGVEKFEREQVIWEIGGKIEFKPLPSENIGGLEGFEPSTVGS